MNTHRLGSMVPSGDAERKVASRRSHRKSRLGCANCKRRRIKCDEKKPACTNCVRHAIHCDFLLPASQTSRASAGPSNSASPSEQLTPTEPSLADAATPMLPGSTPSPWMDTSTTPSSTQGPSGLDVAQLELFHHYCTSTAYTLYSLPGLQNFWRVNAPSIGFSHPFVLHGLLSMAASHLSRFDDERRDYFQRQMEHHWGIAIRTATSVISHVDSENAPALYLFAVVASFIALGRGPRPGDFLIFGDKGVCEHRVLFHTIKLLVETSKLDLIHGILAPTICPGGRRVTMVLEHDKIPEESEHLKELRLLLQEIEVKKDPNCKLYRQVATSLWVSYALVFDVDHAEGQLPTHGVFVWLFRLSDEFVECARQRKPVALVIFAHFCVLLHTLESSWWMKGWVYHLMSGIYKSLDREFRVWVQWPIEQIGWVPPTR
ncbi:C6 zinc finger protein [Phyllosticta capitalensis]